MTIFEFITIKTLKFFPLSKNKYYYGNLYEKLYINKYLYIIKLVTFFIFKIQFNIILFFKF